MTFKTLTPDDAWTLPEWRVRRAICGVVESLNPATNPYLRSAADMAALGFTGEPYAV